jgi:hypothetical protein
VGGRSRHGRHGANAPTDVSLHVGVGLVSSRVSNRSDRPGRPARRPHRQPRELVSRPLVADDHQTHGSSDGRSSASRLVHAHRKGCERRANAVRCQSQLLDVDRWGESLQGDRPPEELSLPRTPRTMSTPGAPRVEDGQGGTSTRLGGGRGVEELRGERRRPRGYVGGRGHRPHTGGYVDRGGFMLCGGKVDIGGEGKSEEGPARSQARLASLVPLSDQEPCQVDEPEGEHRPEPVDQGSKVRRRRGPRRFPSVFK